MKIQRQQQYYTQTPTVTVIKYFSHSTFKRVNSSSVSCAHISPYLSMCVHVHIHVAVFHSLAPGSLKRSITRLSRPVFFKKHTRTHTQTTLTRQMVAPPLPKCAHTYTNNGEGTGCFSCLSLSLQGWHWSCQPSIHQISFSPSGDPLLGPPVTAI